MAMDSMGTRDDTKPFWTKPHFLGDSLLKS